MMMCLRCELVIMLSTHHVTNYLTCRNKFDLKNMKMQYQKYQKMQFGIQSYIDIRGIILYLEANPYQLKTKNINSIILIAPSLNN